MNYQEMVYIVIYCGQTRRMSKEVLVNKAIFLLIQSEDALTFLEKMPLTTSLQQTPFSQW